MEHVTKNLLRKKYRSIRKSICNKEMLDVQIVKNFFDKFAEHNFGIIAGYIPIDSEVNSLHIMSKLFDLGNGIVVPQISARKGILSFYNFYQEKISQVKCDIIPDLIIVPLIAFNEDCHRLGFGGGSFDRTIEYFRNKKCDIICVGLAYQQQLCDQLEPEPHDQKLDAIVTQNKIYSKKF